MTQNPIRRIEHIRCDCARKLQSIEKSGMFTAILASLLDEDWTTPNITDLRFARNNRLIGRTADEGNFKPFPCLKADLIRNIQRVATTVELDGDELGYLLGKVGEIKSID